MTCSQHIYEVRPRKDKRGVVAGLCFLGTICFLLWPKELKERLGDDVFKLTYQFLLLVVIGGALSVVYQEFRRHRDDEAKQREQDAARREAERVLQRQFLADLVEVYQAAMKVRRLLQAKAREHIPATTVMLVHANPYEEQMLALLDVHLDFQSLESRAETISLSRPITAKLAANPRSIDKYFNEIVSMPTTSPHLLASRPHDSSTSSAMSQTLLPNTTPKAHSPSPSESLFALPSLHYKG